MEISRESQIAGDNSQQIQAGTIVINQGISEQRVREVCSELSQQTIAECTAEATAVAQARMNDFANVLIPRIQQLEEDFHSFSDPSFQVLLRKAQLTAACTTRENDYSVLSELLVHRVKNKTDIKKKASIAKAVEIIDQIDDDSLNAMTLFLAMSQFWPVSGSISGGMDALDNLFSHFDTDQLPTNDLWMDNLSILGAANIVSFGSLKKYEQYTAETLSGYACVGIKKDSPEYRNAIELLKGNSISETALVDHELMPEYVRLPLPNKIAIDTLQLVKQNNGEGSAIDYPITDQQKKCFREIWNMYSKDSTLLNQIQKLFGEKQDEYPSIRRAKCWWNEIKGSFSLTSVGKVIAHTNAKSIDPTLPDLD